LGEGLVAHLDLRVHMDYEILTHRDV
jgi:hypothetical protein